MKAKKTYRAKVISMTQGVGWSPINGYHGYYEVHRSGRVRSKIRTIFYKQCNRRLRGKILSPQLNSKGYERVQLCKSGVRDQRFVHRLVAKTFIPNPGLKKQVNHKNGKKRDNRVVNLEWVTGKENILHAYKTGLIRPRVVKMPAKVFKLPSRKVA